MSKKNTDYYGLLQVSHDADREVIKAAFRVIMSKLGAHPDKGGDVERAKALMRAYETLSDPVKRAEYDTQLKSSPHPERSDVVVVVQPKKASVKNTHQGFQPGFPTGSIHYLKGGTAVTVQKRTLARIPVDREVFIRLPDKHVVPARLKDLSGSGARIKVTEKLSTGMIVEICMTRQDLPFVLTQVVHVVKSGKEYGVKWLEIFEGHLPKGLLSRTVV